MRTRCFMRNVTLFSLILQMGLSHHIYFSLGRVHTTQKNTNAGYPDKGREYNIKFVIACSYSAICLESSEKSLYLIPPLVQFLIIFPGSFPIPSGRYNRIKL